MNRMQTLGGTVHPARRGMSMLWTVLLLAAVCTGYVAEAQIRSTSAARPTVSATAARLDVAETLRDGAQVGAGNLATSWIIDESFWLDAGRIQDPRECDLPGGIATACLFMD
jgi:hypothetical protein